MSLLGSLVLASPILRLPVVTARPSSHTGRRDTKVFPGPRALSGGALPGRVSGRTDTDERSKEVGDWSGTHGNCNVVGDWSRQYLYFPSVVGHPDV